jgi:hypothetical protein
MGNISPEKTNPEIYCFSCKWFIIEKEYNPYAEYTCTSSDVYCGMSILKCKYYENILKIELPKELFEI